MPLHHYISIKQQIASFLYFACAYERDDKIGIENKYLYTKEGVEKKKTENSWKNRITTRFFDKKETKNVRKLTLHECLCLYVRICL